MKHPKPISPENAAELVRGGALLVDIRESEERSGGFIFDAQHAPLSGMQPGCVPADGKPVIFHCRTGKRTRMNAQTLCDATDASEVYLLDGGFDAWSEKGLPTTTKGS